MIVLAFLSTMAVLKANILTVRTPKTSNLKEAHHLAEFFPSNRVLILEKTKRRVSPSNLIAPSQSHIA